MKAKSIDKLLEFIEKENLLPKLEEFLKPVPVENDRFSKFKNLLGATGGPRGDSEELKAKFIAFMEEEEGGTDATVGVHIDLIATAQRGVEKKKTRMDRSLTSGSKR